MEKLVVSLSGTPGVGKSEVGVRVARSLGMDLLELSTIVVEKGFYAGYDNERRSYVIDEAGLRRYIRDVATKRGRVLVVGHYGEIVDDDLLDKIVVLRLNPLELAKRLIDRGWPARKVLENAEAELMGICTSNALSEHPAEKVCEVDVTGKSLEEVAEEVVQVVTGSRPCKVYVNWLDNEEIVSHVLRLESSLIEQKALEGSADVEEPRKVFSMLRLGVVRE